MTGPINREVLITSPITLVHAETIYGQIEGGTNKAAIVHAFVQKDVENNIRFLFRASGDSIEPHADGSTFIGTIDLSQSVDPEKVMQDACCIHQGDIFRILNISTQSLGEIELAGLDGEATVTIPDAEAQAAIDEAAKEMED